MLFNFYNAETMHWQDMTFYQCTNWDQSLCVLIGRDWVSLEPLICTFARGDDEANWSSEAVWGVWTQNWQISSTRRHIKTPFNHKPLLISCTRLLAYLCSTYEQSFNSSNPKSAAKCGGHVFLHLSLYYLLTLFSTPLGVRATEGVRPVSDTSRRWYNAI